MRDEADTPDVSGQGAADLPPRPRRIRRGFWLLCWLLTVAVYAAYVFAYAWPQDLRGTAVWPSRMMRAAFMIRTFRFHVGVAVLLLVAVALPARRWRLLLTNVAAALFLLAPTLVGYVPRFSPPAIGATFTIMSANLLYTNLEPDAIAAEIRAADADVLVLQEYTPRWHAAISAAVGGRYPYHEGVQRTDAFGVAIYSRLPIEELRTDVSVGTYDSPQIRAVLNHEGRRFVLYDIHLMPPLNDWGFLEQRLGLADLLEQLSSERDPLIVCGDFNFTADSHFADRVHALGLRDAHDLAATGRGATWPVLGWRLHVPGLRLDHIYVGGAFTVTESRTGVGDGSDHRPVHATIGWAAPEP